MFGIPAHKAKKSPPGQVVNRPADPVALPFGHDRRLPRWIKKGASDPKTTAPKV